MRNRIVSLVFISISVLLLPGCNSSGKIAELESRVAHLENLLDVNATTADAGKQDPAESKTTDKLVESTAPEITDNNEYACPLDTKTADEIVSLCDKMLSNLPQQGQSPENYEKSLIVKPIQSYSLDYELLYEFVDYSQRIERDTLFKIGVSGIQKEMDGSIGYDSSYVGNGRCRIDMELDMVIKEYERAAALYDKLFTSLAHEYNETRVGPSGIVQEKNGTIWSSYASVTESGEIGFKLEMEKIEDGFYIAVKKINVL